MVESCQGLDDPIVSHVLVGLLAGVGQHLPEGHRERPHVRLGGEFTLKRTQTRSVGERAVVSDTFALSSHVKTALNMDGILLNRPRHRQG